MEGRGRVSVFFFRSRENEKKRTGPEPQKTVAPARARRVPPRAHPHLGRHLVVALGLGVGTGGGRVGVRCGACLFLSAHPSPGGMRASPSLAPRRVLSPHTPARPAWPGTQPPRGPPWRVCVCVVWCVVGGTEAREEEWPQSEVFCLVCRLHNSVVCVRPRVSTATRAHITRTSFHTRVCVWQRSQRGKSRAVPPFFFGRPVRPSVVVSLAQTPFPHHGRHLQDVQAAAAHQLSCVLGRGEGGEARRHTGGRAPKMGRSAER